MRKHFSTFFFISIEVYFTRSFVKSSLAFPCEGALCAGIRWIPRAVAAEG